MPDRSSKEITIRAYGKPEPKGSKRAVPNRSKDPAKRGRSVVIDNNSAALKRWSKTVNKAALEVRRSPPWEGPMQVVCVFYLPRPKRVALLKTPMHHTEKPDADKLERAVWDALSGVIYVDDKQVSVSSKWKFYETVDQAIGVVVRVSKLT